MRVTVKCSNRCISIKTLYVSNDSLHVCAPCEVAVVPNFMRDANAFRSVKAANCQQAEFKNSSKFSSIAHRSADVAHTSTKQREKNGAILQRLRIDNTHASHQQINKNRPNNISDVSVGSIELSI